MKIRNGFVSNSSSTSFVIRNKTDKTLTVLDFVTENPQLVEWFNEEYNYNWTQEDMIRGAIKDQRIFPPNMEIDISFGDEDGTVIGQVFDYILREGGSSKSFEWQFGHWER